MGAPSKARLVGGELYVPPLTPREQAELLMDPTFFRAFSIFVTLSDEDKDRALAEARRMLREKLVEDGA